MTTSSKILGEQQASKKQGWSEGPTEKLKTKFKEGKEQTQVASEKAIEDQEMTGGNPAVTADEAKLKTWQMVDVNHDARQGQEVGSKGLQ